MPDFAGLKRVKLGSTETARMVVVIVGEVKVVYIGRNGDKYRILVGRADDVDMDEDDTPGTEPMRAPPPSVASTAKFDTIVEKDARRKWQAGTAKVVVYSLTSAEYCNARLAFPMIGTKFSRMVLLEVDPVPVYAVEVTSSYLATHSTNVLTMANFLGDTDNHVHLAHDIFDHTTRTLDYTALCQLLELFEAGMHQLLSHSFLPPYQNLPWNIKDCQVAERISASATKHRCIVETENNVFKYARQELKNIATIVSATSSATRNQPDDDHNDDDHGSEQSRRGKPKKRGGAAPKKKKTPRAATRFSPRFARGGAQAQGAQRIAATWPHDNRTADVAQPIPSSEPYPGLPSEDAPSASGKSARVELWRLTVDRTPPLQQSDKLDCPASPTVDASEFATLEGSGGVLTDKVVL